MIHVIRNADGTIKTFSENPENDFQFTGGETIELVDSSFTDYARRFILHCQGKSAELVTARVGDPALSVSVECPGQPAVDIDINDSVERVNLIEGIGQILLSTAEPGLFLIQPADRKTYAAAGNGLLSIEVLP